MAPEKPAPFDLRYERHGAGAPILFLAGTADDRAAWAEVVPEVPGFEYLLPDNRDVGESPRAQSGYSVADMALDSIRVLDSAGVERAHVIGHSMGAAIAQELALAAPERTRSLVLIGGFARPDEYLGNAIKRWIHWIRTLETEEFLRNTIPYWVGSETINNLGLEALVELIAPQIRTQGADAFCRQLEAVLEYDTSGRLHEITAPTLLIAGDGDILIRKNHERQLLEGIKDCDFAVIADSGHSPTIEQPVALGEVLRNFLGRV